MQPVSKKQFTSGAIWKIIESFSAKGISLVVSIVLARILLPADYGVIALTQIFTNLSDILIDGGFSTTLIRKKNVDDCDYSCVLTVSFSIATILYLVFFFTSPFVANYYEEPRFSPVLRVLGLTLFIQAFTATRTAVVNRNMQFKLLCYCNITGSLISGIIGIIAAYSGLGVWALVIQRLLQQALVTGLLFIKVKFKIKWQFSWVRLKEIVNFSIGVVSASLLYFVGNNMYSAVVGKKYSVTDLGYYSKGCQLPEQISLYTFSAVSGVLLPTISSCQDDLERVKRIIRKVTSFTGYIIFPLMIGLMCTSNELITLLLTSKWLPAAPIMIGWAIYYMAMPFTLMNSQVYYALGHSFMKLKVEFIRIILMVVGLFIGSFIFNCSIQVLAIIGGAVMVVSAIISAFEAGKMIQYCVKEMFEDLLKPLISSIVMGGLVFLFANILSALGVKGIIFPLAFKVIFGVFIYLMLSILLKMEGFLELKDIIFNLLKRRTHE